MTFEIALHYFNYLSPLSTTTTINFKIHTAIVRNRSLNERLDKAKRFEDNRGQYKLKVLILI